MSYRDPTPEELKSPMFERIWQTIKTWDINVPSEYSGYTGATGNHVCAILDAVQACRLCGYHLAEYEHSRHDEGRNDV